MKRVLFTLFLCFSTLQAEDIFFDLGEVLFRPSKTEIVFNKIGLRKCLGYYTQPKKPQNAKRYLFDCLARSKKRNPNVPVACYGDLPLPQYIEDWLSGTYESNQALLDEVQDKINDLDISDPDKVFLNGVAGYMFDPQAFADTIRIIPQGLEILRACYNKRNPDGSRANRLYVISNWDAESIQLIKNRPDLQEFWGMFEPDGIIISGQEKAIKPAQPIFNIARQRAGIEEGGIFIDDQPENIQASNALGFNGILCDSHKNVWARLEELDVVEPRTFVQKNQGRIKSAVTLAIAAGALYYAGPVLAKTAIGQWIATTRLAQAMSNFMGTLSNLSRVIS